MVQYNSNILQFYGGVNDQMTRGESNILNISQAKEWKLKRATTIYCILYTLYILRNLTVLLC